MGDKKKTPAWLIVLLSVILVVSLIVIIGGVIGVVYNHNHGTTVTTPGTPATPAQPAKPANLGSAWPTVVAFTTCLQNGDYTGAYSYLTESDRSAIGSPSALQTGLAGVTFNPSYLTLVSEVNDGQKATLTIHNSTSGKTMITPFYNEGGAWHIAFSEQTTGSSI